nr:PD-(D/E)XK nuclease family protein [Eudoraea chungangensis]
MLWNSSQNTYIFGNFNGPKTNNKVLLSQNFVPYSLTNKDSNRFKIITKNATEWDTIQNDAIERGNLVHYALGLIHTKKDIDSAIHHLVKKKPLLKEDISDLRETLYKIVEHPLLKTYFSSNVTIKNESEIITENGLILRPDRIVIQNNKVSVLDYKTGKKYTKYKEQLYQYADTLVQMGYEVENRILIYIGDKIITEFL